jgi:hypothetical protein
LIQINILKEKRQDYTEVLLNTEVIID